MNFLQNKQIISEAKDPLDNLKEGIRYSGQISQT